MKRLLIALAGAALVSGCSGAPVTGPEVPAEVDPSAGTTQGPGHVMFMDIPSDSDYIKSQLAKARGDGFASADQIAALESGSITYEDYERATHATVVCLEEAGVSVSALESTEHQGTSRLSFEFTRGSSTLTDDQIAEHYENCDKTHLAYISSYWEVNSAQAWAYQERRARATWEPYAQCLRDKGNEVPDDATFDDLMNLDSSPHCYLQLELDKWDG